MKAKCNADLFALAGFGALLFLATTAEAVAEPTPSSGRRSTTTGASQGSSIVGAKKATPHVSGTGAQPGKQIPGKSAEDAGREVNAKSAEKSRTAKTTFLPLLKSKPRESNKSGGIDKSQVAANLPDLTVLDMKIGTKAAYKGLHVLVKNRGQADAGPFILGVRYYFSEASESSSLQPVSGLSKGKETWVTVPAHNVGWKGESEASTAEKIWAMADPRYYVEDIGWDGKPVSKTKEPVIDELNEENNELTVNKADLKPWP